MKKKLLSFILCISLLAGAAFTGDLTVSAAAESSAAQSVRTETDLLSGLLPMEEITLPEDSVPESARYQGSLSGSGVQMASQAYSSDWEKYGSYYFYNQMSDEGRAFYDTLNKMCLKYLTGNDDMEDLKTYGYATQFVSAGKLKEEEATNIVKIFCYNHPQYYFLRAGYLGAGNLYAIPCYRAFVNGTARSKATAAVKAQLAALEPQIAAAGKDFEKVRVIHDLINAKVTYSKDMEKLMSELEKLQLELIQLEGTPGKDKEINAVKSKIDNKQKEINEKEEEVFSQTVYSVLCGSETVCAGYSQTFAMLCNGAGIDAVSVTSFYHEWNKVRLEDSWYNVDLTWDDTADGGYYLFYVISDDMMAKLEGEQMGTRGENHQAEAFWSGYLPACTRNSTSYLFDPGTLPPTTKTAAAPRITVQDSWISITAAEKGAQIYYTLDGKTAPSPASVKCYRYTGKIPVHGKIIVWAIAVQDSMRDSAVAKQDGSAHYTVTYHLNGGKNAKANPTGYYALESISLKNPTRTGYTFSGWYTDKKFKTKVTKISGNKNLNLYAKWTPHKYTVVYKGNKNTSGKMSSQTSRKYGTAFKLAANKFKRKGYTFKGWNTKANGKGKSYTNKKSVKNLTSKSGGKVTLYAQWKKNTYKITYKLNNGKNNKGNPKTYTVTSKTIKLKAPTRKGYVFKGWYADKKYKKKVTQIKKGSTGNKVLYAKWKKK